jgi:hypothetical protein
MKSTWFVAAIGTVMVASAAGAAPAISSPQQGANAVHAVEGQMLITADGARLARVYHVNADGSVQVILDYRMVTVPVNTLSVKNGELTTTLTRKQVNSLN